MPFDERIEQNRSSINFLFTGEDLLQVQLENLKWDVGRLRTASPELRATLMQISSFKPKDPINRLWLCLERLEAEFQRNSTISMECKIYALAHCTISLNNFLLSCCLEYSQYLVQQIKEWESIQRRKYWYLFEKTPVFWYSYLWLNRELNPNLEVSRKLTNLRNANRSLMLFLGANNFILNQYDSLMDEYDSLKPSQHSNASVVVSSNPTMTTENPIQVSTNETTKIPASFTNLRREPSRENVSAIYSNPAGVTKTPSTGTEKAGTAYQTHFKPESKEAFGRLLGVLAANQKVVEYLLKFKRQERARFDDPFLRAELERELRVKEISNDRLAWVVDKFRGNLARVSSFVDELHMIVAENERPYLFQQRWLRYSLVTAGTLIVAPIIWRNRQLIVDSVLNLATTIKNFYHRYILTPIVDIYKTIRYDRSSFAFMDEKALNHEVEDLGKMLIQYSQRYQGVIHQDQVLRLLEDAKRGDLKSVMGVYDDLIQKPIKNALFGDLIELLLIQIQKQKVDISKAMLALDKLMRANELNFQMIALIPAVLLSGVGVISIGGYLARKISQVRAYAVLRTQVRDVSRLLTLSSEREYLTFEETGLLLVLLDQVRSKTRDLPRKQGQFFAQDVHDLELESFTIQQRQLTIERMYRSYPFLTEAPGVL